MKEIKEIIAAYDIAVANGKKTALATVVHVEGSSYRRPGARMLVTDDGMLTGAISGGCLEGDALRKALLAIHQDRIKLVTYDTTDEEDAVIGVQLGCNGIVHILFEPLHPGKTNAIDLLKNASQHRDPVAVATHFSLEHSNHAGTLVAVAGNGMIQNDCTAAIEPLRTSIENDTHAALHSQSSTLKNYKTTEGSSQAFIQVIPPALSLLIFGAGNDAQPLALIAHQTGWEVIIVDGRHTHATKGRFSTADKIVVSKADQAVANLKVDRLTVAVLMTHNYNYDIKILEDLLATDCKYIGVLGPKKKMERMAEELSSAGVVIGDEEEARIFSPVGLDIGAETAEEIALSIAAEIKAVMAEKSAQSLKTKPGPIHERDETYRQIVDK